MASNNLDVRRLENIPLGDTSQRVLGRGISYPFSFASTGKAENIDVTQGVAKINQSIMMILSTRVGERIMLPEYGSRLPELVFDPNDEILHAELQFYTADALSRWEKRITVTSVVTVDNSDASEVGIHIEYLINKLHVIGSFVYPFQLGALPLSESVFFGGRQ
jgi:phage baseplate assembly protein W